MFRLRSVRVIGLMVALGLLVSTTAASAASGASLAGAGTEAAAAPAVSVARTAASPDYFTDVLGDPRDYANAEDQFMLPEAHQNTIPRVEGGLLRWPRGAPASDVSLVWHGFPGGFFVGRDGPNVPVDADRYTHVSVRLHAPERTAASVSWDACDGDVDFNPACNGNSNFIVDQGWGTYVLRLADVGGESGWRGLIRAVRLSVAGAGDGSEVAVDWVRFFAPTAGLDVAYQGGELFWDADDDLTNNTPDSPGWGLLHTGGGAAVFPADAYPPGTYRFYTVPAASAASAASVPEVPLPDPAVPTPVPELPLPNPDPPTDPPELPLPDPDLPLPDPDLPIPDPTGRLVSAPVTVDAPVPVFIEPDAVGGVDYATSVLGDAWDFSQATDVSRIENVVDVEWRDGRLYGTNGGRVPGDNFFHLRGGASIDTERFHRLTITAGLEGGLFDLGVGPGGGSHGRLMWYREDSAYGEDPYQSRELVLYPSQSTYTVELDTDPPEHVMEHDDPRKPGWIGPDATTLRWDPNEDPGPRRWWVDDFALRADDETSGDAFDVRWRDASPGDQSGTTVALYYDTDDTGFDGRLIAEGLEQDDEETTYRWDTRNVPTGRYHLYAVATRHGVEGRRYAGGPVVVGGRLSGNDRITTAVAVSRAAFPGTAPAAVIASGGTFPDALAAAPLAAAAGGPLLLNPSDRLSPAVAEELDRLRPGTVYLMGGQAAQSDEVARALASPGVDVVRVAGSNRFATAAAAAEEAVALWREAGDGAAGDRVLVASGANFPDALAAGPLAAASHQPLLLADPSDVPGDTAAMLESLDSREVTVVGGAAAVGDPVMAQLGAGRDVRRLSGSNRYATAAAVAREAVTAGANPDDVLLAAGGSFADALGAGPAAAARGGVLLLTDRDDLPPETEGHLAERAGSLTWLRVTGGPAAVTDAVVRDALRASGRW